MDGGENFKEVPWGGDTHDIWIDPTNADRFVITDDGGLSITTVHGRGFHRATLPIGQMYHVDVDNQIPYYFYSNMQDDGNMRGPSLPVDSRETGWDHAMGGCESGFTVPDLADPNVVWATCYGNKVTRWDARTKHARSVSPWMHTLDSPPNDIKYRCHWTAPLAVDPFDHNTVYYGCQVIFKTTNAARVGRSSARTFPPRTRLESCLREESSAITSDNSTEKLFSRSHLPKFRRDSSGQEPTMVRSGIQMMARTGSTSPRIFQGYLRGARSRASRLRISIPRPHTSALISISWIIAIRSSTRPRISGKTWKQISGNLPKHALSYVRTIAEDPNCEGLLFAGTGSGLYYSLDDGGHWTALETGLPHAPVTWAVVQKEFHDLVISTYGRGLYIFDDITPLGTTGKESL